MLRQRRRIPEGCSVGGLNFEIEHHPFPRVQHTHYAHIAAIVRVMRVLLPRTPAFSFSGGCRRSRDASLWCQRVERVAAVCAAQASILRCAAASSSNNKARSPGRNRPAESRFVAKT
jgi:hypothetical protein